jgi:hypothetical protein
MICSMLPIRLPSYARQDQPFSFPEFPRFGRDQLFLLEIAHMDRPLTQADYDSIYQTEN